MLLIHRTIKMFNAVTTTLIATLSGHLEAVLDIDIVVSDTYVLLQLYLLTIYVLVLACDNVSHDTGSQLLYAKVRSGV